MQDSYCVCKLPWKNCHSYTDHLYYYLLIFETNKPNPSSDDCGAPIQNTTAELLTISQLLVKDAYRPEPKPMADSFGLLLHAPFGAFSLYFRLSCLFAWWKRFHYWHLKQRPSLLCCDRVNQSFAPIWSFNFCFHFRLWITYVTCFTISQMML